MRKKIYLLPATAIIVFYLAYILPFGLNQSKLEKEFNEIRTLIAKFNKEIIEINNLKSYNQKIDEIVNLNSRFVNFKVLYNNFEIKRNFLRNSLWKKQAVFIADLNNIDCLFLLLNTSMPGALSKTIENDNKKVALIGNDQNSVGNIRTNLEKYKADLIELSYKLELFNKDFSNPDLSISETDLDKICTSNSKILVNISSHETRQKYDLLNNIKQSTSVENIDEQIKRFNSFLSDVKNSYRIIGEIGASPTALNNVNSRLEHDIKEINGITNLLRSILIAQSNSNDLLKNALNTMDLANSRLNNMEKFASSEDILTVYYSWEEAENEVRNSKSPLYFSGNLSTHKIIWDNLNERAKNNIDKILVDVSNHKDFVHSEYSKAREEESTYLGNTTRTVQRGWNRLKNVANEALNEAKSSRIGRELSLSAQMLMLGTKAFYDLQNPGADPLTWAMSYENEVNSIMKESEEIMEMDGPSLTGKNTFIEKYANKAYDK